MEHILIIETFKTLSKEQQMIVIENLLNITIASLKGGVKQC